MFAIALTLLGISLFVVLGVWQLDRMQQKRAMLEAAAAILAERRPVLLSAAADATRASSYDWSAGSGAFAGAEPLLLDNQFRNGRVGVRVFRLFHPEDVPGVALLIDLGWLPLAMDRKLPVLPPPPTGRIDIRGLLAPPPAAGLALGGGIQHVDRAWLLTRIDPVALAQAVGEGPGAIAPRVLRLDPALPLGFERDLDVLPNTLPPERHLGYAVQWFAFALVALTVFVGLHWRKVENAKK